MSASERRPPRQKRVRARERRQHWAESTDGCNHASDFVSAFRVSRRTAGGNLVTGGIGPSGRIAR